jgi:hypothetical protein
MRRGKKIDSFRKQMAQSMADLVSIIKGGGNEADCAGISPVGGGRTRRMGCRADKKVCPTKGGFSTAKRR